MNRAALLLLLAAGCASLRLGRPVRVDDGVSSFLVQEVRVKARTVGWADAEDGLVKVDERTLAFHEFVMDPIDEIDGRSGDWLLVDLETGETTPVRAPGFDPYFSAPAFQGALMAYWAFGNPRPHGADYRVVAVRVWDVLARRPVGEVRIEPPIPAPATDFPFLLKPVWWMNDAVFRHEGDRWIVTVPARPARRPRVGRIGA